MLFLKALDWDEAMQCICLFDRNDALFLRRCDLYKNLQGHWIFGKVPSSPTNWCFTKWEGFPYSITDEHFWWDVQNMRAPGIHWMDGFALWFMSSNGTLSLKTVQRALFLHLARSASLWTVLSQRKIQSRAAPLTPVQPEWPLPAV